MAWRSYPPLDRSPRVPPTRHRKRRDAVFITFTTLPQKTSRDSRVEKNLLFSPDHSLALSFLSLSLAFRKKDARPSSPEKHVGRSRKKTPPKRRWDRRAFGTVGVSRKSSSEGTNRVLFFLCLHGERLKVFSLSSSCPPLSKKNKPLNQPPPSHFFLPFLSFSIGFYPKSEYTCWRWSFDTAPENIAHERRSVVSKGGPTSRKRNTAREERRRRKREENVEPNDCVGIIIIIIIAERSLAGEPTER